jgi:hypothetical protein
MPEIDGQSFEHIETIDRDKWLGNLAMELRERTYTLGAVRKILIPNTNGASRRDPGGKEAK